MCNITVVNIIKVPSYDVYIGRPNKLIPARLIIDDTEHHFGNPFTHRNDIYYKSDNLILVTTREHAVNNYRDWLLGRLYLDLEPERNKWIRDNLHHLKAQILGCWCKPLACHGDVLKELVELLP